MSVGRPLLRPIPPIRFGRRTRAGTSVSSARGRAAAVAIVGAALVLNAPAGARAQAPAEPPPSSPVGTATTAAPDRPLPTVADHQAQLRSFRLRIEALRSKIAGVEARVAGLKQTVLVGTVMTTRARLIHRNEMSGSFRLQKAVYRLDDEVIFSRENDDKLSDAEEIMLFDGPLTAGAHAVDVEMVFHGASVGVFTYLQGYKFKVRSRYQLDVVEGRNTVLKIVAYEAEDLTVEARDRFKVRYDVEVNDEAPAPATP